MRGVSTATVSGNAENNTALRDEVMYCCAQNCKAYGIPITVKPRTKIAFHWRPSRGHIGWRNRSQINRIAAAARKRSAAARNGGRYWTTTCTAIQVLPQMRHRET